MAQAAADCGGGDPYLAPDPAALGPAGASENTYMLCCSVRDYGSHASTGMSLVDDI